MDRNIEKWIDIKDRGKEEDTVYFRKGQKIIYIASIIEFSTKKMKQ